MSQEEEKQQFPPQTQDRQPGRSEEMTPRPIDDDPEYRGFGKLSNLVALITGGDSGIGRAAVIAFAKEGAKAAFVFLASTDAAYISGQTIHPNGGEIING